MNWSGDWLGPRWKKAVNVRIKSSHLVYIDKPESLYVSQQYGCNALREMTGGGGGREKSLRLVKI